MGKSKQVTPRKRAVITTYHKDGVSVRSIATKCGVPKSTVAEIVKRFDTTGDAGVLKRSGRPKVTSPREDNIIRRLVVKTPSISSTEIKLELASLASTRTISRRLSDNFGLRSRRPAKKPLLNDKQRRKRLQFCQKYKHWTETDWCKVLFSDESSFCQFGSPVNLIRRPVGTRFDARYTVPTVKHPPKVMVWGCFSGKGRGNLYFVPKGQTVNATEYIKILNSKVPMAMELLGCSIFQQDSAPAHTARKVQDWMKTKKIKLLEWPGNSPDLNPIENLWMILKRKVRLRSPKNMQELMFWIKYAWCREITPGFCKKLATSMPRRLKTVIKNRGLLSKY